MITPANWYPIQKRVSQSLLSSFIIMQLLKFIIQTICWVCVNVACKISGLDCGAFYVNFSFILRLTVAWNLKTHYKLQSCWTEKKSQIVRLMCNTSFHDNHYHHRRCFYKLLFSTLLTAVPIEENRNANKRLRQTINWRHLLFCSTFS